MKKKEEKEGVRFFFTNRSRGQLEAIANTPFSCSRRSLVLVLSRVEGAASLERHRARLSVRRCRPEKPKRKGERKHSAMPPHRLFAAAPPRVPKRARADDDHDARRRRRTLPVFPPLPPLEGLSESDLETPGDGLAALMLLRQSWQLDTAGVWPPLKQAPAPVPLASSSASSSSAAAAASSPSPRVSFCPPLLLKTQVHSLVTDRSAVDREIDALR